MAPRVALIHALAQSMAPINEALARDWPACRRMNLLDDSLSADLATRSTGLDDAMTARFVALGDYAVATGADAILFTCSAFGPCIEEVARRHSGRPVLKPNEAMIAQVVATRLRIGLVASFAPTLESMPSEFPTSCALETAHAPGALAALERGDFAGHDRAIADAAARLVARGCEAVALAQFSMARARAGVEARCGCPVFTTVDSAVRALRERLGGE
jgi:hypothetical protein